MGARLFGVVFVQVNCEGAVPDFSCLLPGLVLRKSSDMKCCEQTRVLPVIYNISNVTAISSGNFPIIMLHNGCSCYFFNFFASSGSIVKADGGEMQ